MTKAIYEIRHNRKQRQRKKHREMLNIVTAVAWYVLLMPFAFYSAYVSRGYTIAFGGEWLLLPGYFLLRVIIKGFINEWKEFISLI